MYYSSLENCYTKKNAFEHDFKTFAVTDFVKVYVLPFPLSILYIYASKHHVQTALRGNVS